MYISFTKTYDSMRYDLKDLNGEVFVVDCVTGSLFKKESTVDCDFEQMPQKLSELNTMIDQKLRSKKVDYIVIDSLSQFFDFTSESTGKESIYAFTDALKNLHNMYKVKIVLLYDDNLSRHLKNLPKLFIKNIIKVEMIKEGINWKD